MHPPMTNKCTYPSLVRPPTEQVLGLFRQALAKDLYAYVVVKKESEPGRVLQFVLF